MFTVTYTKPGEVRRTVEFKDLDAAVLYAQAFSKICSVAILPPTEN